MIVGLIFITYGFKQIPKYKLIQNTPTSKAESISPGLVELQGTVAYDEKFQTPLSGQDCVYCKYEVQEYRRVHSHDDDNDQSWVTIDKGEWFVPFYASDETGVVAIDPKGAEMDIGIKNRYSQPRGAGSTEKIDKALNSWKRGFDIELDISKFGLKLDDNEDWSLKRLRLGDREYHESYLAPGENLYVIGTAGSSLENVHELTIRKYHDTPTFIISNEKEHQVVKTLKQKQIVYTIVGCLVIVMGFLIMVFG
jgi:hypothetical protein